MSVLHVARPSLAPSGLVPGINDKSPQVCVPSNPSSALRYVNLTTIVIRPNFVDRGNVVSS